MAGAGLNGRVLGSSLKKGFVRIISGGVAWFPARVAVPGSASFKTRGVHVTSYDKNVDYDLVRPTVVPDYVIDLDNSNNYWTPHPQTGVFGPPPSQEEIINGPSTAKGAGVFCGVGGGKGGSSSSTSVLDQTVWFRPLEGVEDKPQHDY